MPQLYESLFILRPSLADEDIPKMLDKVKATVERAGGIIEHLSHWGKGELAYETKQEKNGIYVQLNYRGNGAVVAQLERLFLVVDAALKYLTMKIEPTKLGRAATEPA